MNIDDLRKAILDGRAKLLDPDRISGVGVPRAKAIGITRENHSHTMIERRLILGSTTGERRKRLIEWGFENGFGL